MAKEIDTTSNSTVYRRLKRRRDTSCSYCPPHDGENKNYKKYPKKKEYELDPNRRHK
jgi:hypothetical protein